MIRSILVPLDGSPFGEHALPLAGTLARQLGCTVRLAHVHAPEDPKHPDWYMPAQQRSDPEALSLQRKYLDTVVAKLAAVGVSTSAILLQGQTSFALGEYVASSDTDLVVMTTHGRGPLSRAWLGSVADAMLRHLNVPLLLVRPTQDPVDLATETKIRNVLIPLDGSAHAEAILERILAIGSAGTSFTLLQAVSPMPVLGYDVFGYAPVGADIDLIEELRLKAVDYLDGVAGRLRERGLLAKTVAVVHPSAASAILAEGESHGCDLIALATHGRSGATRMLLGSVADKVVRGASVPVLIHRNPES
jgi:nucleotide-binding universal stress UspA family protein